ncbi:MAG: transpeptidase family protein [Paramuribaculum sp.]|nr:transpeptidase family protein [Paramuribaculum sp.]
MKIENRQRIFFRYGLVIMIILMVTGFIVYRLVKTTVIDADKWVARADSAFNYVDTIVPKRGDILSSDGNVLATNIYLHTLRIDYQTPGFKKDTLKKYIGALSDSMARYYPKYTSAGWEERIMHNLDTAVHKPSRCYPLISNITSDDVERIKKFPFFNKGKKATGLYDEKDLVRVRPYGSMARRSIGKLTSTNSVIKHGWYGLEKALDSLLVGEPGLTEPMLLTKGVGAVAGKPAVDGYDVYTTIDIGMQDLLENALEEVLEGCRAEWGCSVLIEVPTGDIKAIANLEISPNAGEGYIESINRVVMGFEPGSVVKTLSMLVALENGVVRNINEPIDVHGGKWAYLGGRIWDHLPDRYVPVRRVLEYSSNIATAKIILRGYDQNPGEYYLRVKSTGFLDKMNVGIAGERKPRFDSLPNNSQGRRALASQAYGYATELPPLYTAALYNAIANDGKFVRPRLVKRITGNGIDSTLDVTYVRDRICSVKNAGILREMLEQVVWGEKGTARAVRSDKVKIAGKTGTARRIVDGKYVSEYRYAFCGFFPVDNPRYTCMTLIAYPTQGPRSAAYMSGQVVKKMAEGLYSRGYLGDHAVYSDASAPQSSAPVFMVSTEADRDAIVHERMGLKGKRVLAKNKSVNRHTPGEVPDVTGLSLRQALAVLESAGYRVTVSGAGHVLSQSPLPGSTSGGAGSNVTLTLSY